MYNKIIFISIFLLQINTTFASSSTNKLDPKKWIGKAPDHEFHGIDLETHKVFLKNLKSILPPKKFKELIIATNKWVQSYVKLKENVVYFNYCEPFICSHHYFIYLDSDTAEIMLCETGIFDDKKIKEKDVFWYGNPKSINLINFKRKHPECDYLEWPVKKDPSLVNPK